MSIIRDLGLTDTTSLKFPVGLYTSKDMLRGGRPFAVVISEKGKTRLRAGDINEEVKTRVVVD